jgi:acetolactate synthase I/III small subunit
MTTLLVDAEAKRDVLARVVMLFHRRAVVIPSLSMAPADLSGILHMVITVEADQDQTKRLVADLHKLVNILSVETVT